MIQQDDSFVIKPILRFDWLVGSFWQLWDLNLVLENIFGF